jgi:anthranilate/para-aminobenzoate synthase component I
VTRIAIDIAPDAFAIARRLSARPGLAVLSSNRAGRYGRCSYIACEPTDVRSSLDPFEGAPAASEGGAAPRFIGVLPFEAFRGLERPAWSKAEGRSPPLASRIRWLAYDAVVVVDHETGEVSAEGTPAAARSMKGLVEGSAEPSAPPFTFEVLEGEPGAQHVARVRSAIEKIFAGDLYQVNLARRLPIATDATDPLRQLSLLSRLQAAFPSPFGALIPSEEGASIVASTPELLLDATPSADARSFAALATEPIKGTRRRDPDPAVDAALARELDRDPKERAELAMIIDVERNDLARVSQPGSVLVEEPPHVVSHSTVHHRVARLTSRVRDGITRSEVLSAMVPSGSVTGAPKIRAMEIIAALEPERRGLYTGGFGYLGQDGSLRLAMAIRSLVIGPDGRGEYFSGGGIVASSDPERELEETHWKAAQLSALCERANRGKSL